MSEISWKAIFAGLFVSLMTYLILGALGIAVGGSALVGTITGGGDAGGLGIGTGIWLVVSTMISLFLGAYAAGQTGGLISARVGRIQGIVVSGLFFVLMATQLGNLAGSFGQAIGQVAGAAGNAAGNLSENSEVQSVVNQSLQGLDLKSPPGEVARGLGVRMLRGDTEGAKNYLAYEAGIPREQADARINDMGERFKATLSDVGAKAARGLSIAGWTLFGVFLLGMGSSILGGGIGSGVNLRKPITEADERNLRRVA